METSVSQNTGGESLGAALDITAHATDGTVPGAGAITKANFNDDVNIKVVNKTETTGSGGILPLWKEFRERFSGGQE